LRENAEDNNTTIVGSVVRGVATIPVGLWNWFRGKKHDTAEVPKELCCLMCRQMLHDPCFVQREFMCRSCTNRHIEKGLNGPSGDKVTRNGPGSSPKMKLLVFRYCLVFGKSPSA